MLNVLASNQFCLKFFSKYSLQNLHAVNVGDRGFLLIRKGQEDTFESPKQQKGFNHHHQLGRASGNPSLAQVPPEYVI